MRHTFSNLKRVIIYNRYVGNSKEVVFCYCVAYFSVGGVQDRVTYSCFYQLPKSVLRFIREFDFYVIPEGNYEVEVYERTVA